MIDPASPKVVSVIAVGRRRSVLDEHIEQVPPGPYTVIGVTTADQLADALASGETVGVLLGGGLDDQTRCAYRAQIHLSSPGLPVADHVGGKDEFVHQLLDLMSAGPSRAG